jgi:integrase
MMVESKSKPVVRNKKRTNGLGSIWKTNTGAFRWQVTLGYKGSKRIAKSGTSRNKTEAEKAIAAAVTEHARGGIAEPSKVTVAEWLEKWLEHRTPALSSNTVTSYRHMINGHLVPGIGDIKLQALKPADLRKLYNSLYSRRGTIEEPIALSSRTTRYIHVVLHAALKDAVKLELVMRNVADVVKPETASSAENTHAAQSWTAEEVSQFLEVARDDSLYVLFYLLLALGLRRGEVCGLRWSNIDLDKQLLRVAEARVCIDGKPQSSKPKTAKSRRVLKLPLEVVEVLCAYRVEQQAMFHELKIETSKDWLFTNELGQAIRPDYVNHTLERLTRVSGVRKVRVHDLRHTYASLARRAGVSIEIVSEKLGHARSSFTADVYRHTFEDEHLAAAVSLSDLLASSPQGIS